MMRKQQLFPFQAYLEHLLRQTPGPTKPVKPKTKKISYTKTAEEHKILYTAGLVKYHTTRNPIDGPAFTHHVWDDMPDEIHDIIHNFYEAVCEEALATKSHPYTVSKRVHFIHRRMAITQLLKEIKPTPINVVVTMLGTYISGMPKGTIRDGLHRVLVVMKNGANAESAINQLTRQDKYDGAIDAIRFHYNKAVSGLEVK